MGNGSASIWPTIRPDGVIIAISPHLDDAVMSAGATLHALARNGHEVIVATVFAGDAPAELSPVAQRFHADCGLSDETAMAVRRAEDHRATAMLDCSAVHLEFRDAVFRKDSGGEWLCMHDRGMFDTDAPREFGLEIAIIRAVTALVTGVADRSDVAGLLTCAAVGGHIDHRLTARAVRRCATERQLPLVLWEDLPYACEAGMLAAHPAGREMHRTPSAVDWSAKAAAVQCYSSQLRMLWPADASGWRTLLDHAAARGGELPVEAGWQA